jgi:hypothetical protein
MKINNIIHSLLVFVFLLNITSCSKDFLKEELTTQYSTQYFQTQEGLEGLAVSLYGNLRWHFGYEWAYAITQYGTDEFTTANDLTSEPWNTYDSRFGPVGATVATGAANNNCPSPAALWDELYFGIASANTLIANQKYFTDEESKNRCLGEAYFLRGYNYYRLTAQYGAVTLQTEPVAGVVRNFKRATEEECWAQIISDLEKAYNFLDETQSRGVGTWTKSTAAHFLAKALLFRCSERNDSWNSSYKEADLSKIIQLCDYVIANHPLANDYNDTYANWTGIDCAIEGNSEVLLAALFNGDATAEGRYGNRTYNYLNCQWQTGSAKWVQRGIWIGGMEFQRCRPTEYNYAVFDNVNDARMWKSFKTIFGCTQIANTTLNESMGDAKIVPGDIAIMFILNKKDDHRFDNQSDQFGTTASTKKSTFINPETGKWVPCVFPLYLKGQFVGDQYGSTGNPVTTNFWAGLNKTEDGSRTAEKGNAHRDVTMARTGETYLVKAEALVRQGKYQDAINVVNILRARAQWKNGEDRRAYVDGSKAFETNSLNTGTAATNYKNANLWINSYYISTGITETTGPSNLQITSYTSLPAEDEAVLSSLGVSGDYNRMLNFILNERTRELDGEWLRWEDLSRTKTLVLRAKTFNARAATNIDDHHNLRPIPQSFIDGLLNDDGTNLSDEQKAAWQNPGY